jgi:EAL and modified HD-GYP domain-containing signal transduction protein
MYFYAARQPILDKNKQLVAYELLFRDSIDNVFPEIDAEEATSKMIEASQFNLGINEFTANKPAFINFTLDTMSKGYPTMLTPDEVVVEILETVKPGKKLLSLCKELYKSGYTLALDDYEHKNVWTHFYPFIKIIKIDLQQTSFDEVKLIKQAISNHPHIQLLAEKVETYEEYNQALTHGFELFQGFFFAKPEMVKARHLSPSQMTMAELLYETSKPELDLSGITSVFERDVSLSYKLLRYANSPIFRRRSEIATIKQALVILGSGELKRFIGLMFAVNINPDKPNELVKTSMTRAKFCELMAREVKDKQDSSIAFLTGLLSMIDAILDEEIGSILEKLPLAQVIKDTLLIRKSTIAKVIKLVEQIEHANWQQTTLSIAELGVDKEAVITCYHQSLSWADEQSSLTEQINT